MSKLIKKMKRAGRYIIKGVPVIEAEISYISPNEVLKDRNILITGGTRGIGRSIAEVCIKEGAKVVIVGRNKESCEKVAQEIKCKFIQGDVTNITFIHSVIDQAEELIGSHIDSIVSNAGISLHEGGFRNVTEETWDRQMDTNLKAGFFLCQEFVSYVERKGIKKSSILVITSERARRADEIPYGLTKVASDSYIKAFASSLISQGIRVNGLAPGVTVTDMTNRGKDGNLVNCRQKSGRLFLPEEVAEVAKFLLSDAAGCISGEIIACNQGNHISTWF